MLVLVPVLWLWLWFWFVTCHFALQLKGSKLSDWEGGIRGNAFVSGGFLQKHAHPSRIGSKLEGFTHICDWCKPQDFAESRI